MTQVKSSFAGTKPQDSGEFCEESKERRAGSTSTGGIKRRMIKIVTYTYQYTITITAWFLSSHTFSFHRKHKHPYYLNVSSSSSFTFHHRNMIRLGEQPAQQDQTRTQWYHFHYDVKRKEGNWKPKFGEKSVDSNFFFFKRISLQIYLQKHSLLCLAAIPLCFFLISNINRKLSILLGPQNPGDTGMYVVMYMCYFLAELLASLRISALCFRCCHE